MGKGSGANSPETLRPKPYMFEGSGLRGLGFWSGVSRIPEHILVYVNFNGYREVPKLQKWTPNDA